MTKAKLWQSEDKKIKCLACQRYCLIPKGKTGFCQTRLNKNGVLYSLTYGLITGIQIDPIEKKPLYHFKPGSLVASIGSLGCNFRCKQCLNFTHSYGAKETLQALVRKPIKPLSSQTIINQILKQGLKGIAFTFNEPVINPEFIHDTAKLAKDKGLFTVIVSNGSWTKKALNYYGKFIDAANIDLKGFSQKTYQKQGAFFGKILEMLVWAKKKKIHLELTTLIIPTINDNFTELGKMAGWIKKNLGADTPWHLSRFDPQLAPDPGFQKLSPTPLVLLEKIAQIGREKGLNFVHTRPSKD